MDTLPKISQNENIDVSTEGLSYILKNFDATCPDRNFLWTTDYKTELPVRVKKSGPGSQIPYTFSQLWQRAVKEFPNAAALNFEVAPNKWVTWDFQKYYDESCTFAKGLIALGVTNYSTLNIIGFNSVYWAVAFSGSILGNYLPIGIYTTNGPDACEYIANHSQCEVVVLQNVSHLEKYIAIKEKIPKIKYFIMWTGQIPTNLDKDFEGKVLTWNQFMQIGRKQYNPTQNINKLQSRMAQAKPGNCCTFIYTSGTTGNPKAVMISHDNYTWVSERIGKHFQFDSPRKYGKSRIISMLPLSHVAAQLVDLVITLRFGISVFFTDPSALQGNLIKFMLIAKPTFFVCVPRVWEKMQQKISAIGALTTGMKKKIATWAKEKAAEGTFAEVTGKRPIPAFFGLAKKLVFNKIKANLGLDECERFVFSAAPMRQSTRQFFLNLNILLQNVYGMSELSGPESVTDLHSWDTFSSPDFLREAGKTPPGFQLAIDNPDAQGNGEICLRGKGYLNIGRNCFMGYFKNEEETRKTIDSKGFVHSGDVGKIGLNGSLAITGRIKELLITAGGENVAPVLIENVLNTALPIFSHAVVIGDKKKYLTVLLCLKLKDPINLTQQVVAYFSQKGSPAKTIQEAMHCKIVKQIINEGIAKTNEKAISKAQYIQKFHILPHEFSVDGNQLTPTLKLKRKVINELYEKEINGMYVDAKL